MLSRYFVHVYNLKFAYSGRNLSLILTSPLIVLLVIFFFIWLVLFLRKKTNYNLYFSIALGILFLIYGLSFTITGIIIEIIDKTLWPALAIVMFTAPGVFYFFTGLSSLLWYRQERVNFSE
ncbi:MAG: hypothetical protein FK730_05880 [Asgard group archaeon]|nr:hypothetical protein [Asgard group archaeon]